MAKVLVTGGTGFIGSKLTERLLSGGDEVTCLVRDPARAESLAKLGARLAIGDVRDAVAVRAAVDGQHTVYHLAGLITAFRAADMTATNVTAFRNIAGACAACTSPPTLIYVSSLAAAGPSSVERPRVESDPCAPVSNYGRSKRAAELIAEQFASQMPITIIRPPIVYGEGDHTMLAVYRSIFRLGVHLALGVAYSRYSLIHVSDLVDALILCARRGTRLPAGGQASGNIAPAKSLSENRRGLSQFCGGHRPQDGRGAGHREARASGPHGRDCPPLPVGYRIGAKSALADSAPAAAELPSAASRGYYFVAGDEQPTFAELGTLIGHAVGRARVVIWRNSSTVLLWSIAAAAEVTARLRGRPFIFNFDKVREAEAGSWTCSSQAIRAQCGFTPYAPLVDRLQQTAIWYRQQNLL